jgi:hypothetical protein
VCGIARSLSEPWVTDVRGQRGGLAPDHVVRQRPLPQTHPGPARPSPARRACRGGVLWICVPHRDVWRKTRRCGGWGRTPRPSCKGARAAGAPERMASSSRQVRGSRQSTAAWSSRAVRVSRMASYSRPTRRSRQSTSAACSSHAHAAWGTPAPVQLPRPVLPRAPRLTPPSSMPFDPTTRTRGGEIRTPAHAPDLPLSSRSPPSRSSTDTDSPAAHSPKYTAQTHGTTHLMRIRWTPSDQPGVGVWSKASKWRTFQTTPSERIEVGLAPPTRPGPGKRTGWSKPDTQYSSSGRSVRLGRASASERPASMRAGGFRRVRPGVPGVLVEF